MTSDPTERTALKEWAVLVDAMARGDVVAMVRKGGIREQRAGFQVRHDRFLLYPTYFHEKAAEVAPRFVPTLDAAHARRPPEGIVRLEYVADVAAVWTVSDLDRLRAIEGEHGLAWPADPLAVAGWYVAGLICFTAIGVALGSLVPSGRSANAASSAWKRSPIAAAAASLKTSAL